MSNPLPNAAVYDESGPPDSINTERALPAKSWAPDKFTRNVRHVFISSPSGLKLERDAVCRAMERWNQKHTGLEQLIYVPVRSEHFVGGMPRPMQQIIDNLLQNSHYLILLMRDRFGSPTGSAESHESGTREEFDKAKETIGREDAAMLDISVFFLHVPGGPVGSHLNAQAEAAARFRKELDEKREGWFEDVPDAETLESRTYSLLEKWQADFEKARAIQKSVQQEKDKAAANLLATRPEATAFKPSRAAYLVLVFSALYMFCLYVDWSTELFRDTLNRDEFVLLSTSVLIIANLLVLIVFRPRGVKLGVPSRSEFIAAAQRYVHWYEWAYLGTLVLGVAVSFALWSMITTLLVPPQQEMLLDGLSQGLLGTLGGLGPKRHLLHMAMLVVGAVVVTSVFTVIARKHRHLAEAHVVWRIGFLGIAIAGLIGLATMLPYSLRDLVDKSSPTSLNVDWLPLASFVILFRIALLPVTGLLASLVTFRLIGQGGGDAE